MFKALLSSRFSCIESSFLADWVKHVCPRVRLVPTDSVALISLIPDVPWEGGRGGWGPDATVICI